MGIPFVGRGSLPYFHKNRFSSKIYPDVAKAICISFKTAPFFRLKPANY
jgi:hypothetical protein